MDSKTLSLLEYPKVLARLAAHCDFSASAELAQHLEPSAAYETVSLRQQETSEARWLLAAQDVSIGGARDMRAKVELARRGGILEAQDLLDLKATLIACRELKKTLEKSAARAPRLAEMALELPLPGGLVDAISRVLSDKGEVLDNASPKLAALRRELKTSHERLMSRLQKYISDPKSVAMLQDALITQRDGRYVIPLRAEFKGQIKSIVHDQSASGATLFVEPLAVVELNNSYRETQIAERNEVLRILAEVSLQIGLAAGEILPGLKALAELDLAFAKAKYAEEIRASEPLLQRADSANAPIIKLYRARHPLLDPASAVANDIDLPPGTRAVVITGPNTGGKTVALKTIGLLALMAQSGLHIPAQSGSEISLFDDIFADIGDEQSIEQSLSTFSGHITNIIRILKKVDARSLVIFDELGAGTDPQEGAALARAILQQLLENGCAIFVATHYPELKNFAHSVAGVVNASLEFDVATLRPTYRLTLGLPGRSNALAIAARLGLPEAIIAAARNVVDPENLRADKLLDDIRKERNRASREREKGEKARARAEEIQRALAERLEKIEDERREVLAKARAEAELEVEVLKRNLGRLKAELKKLRQPLDALEKLEEKVEALEEKAAAPVARKTTPREEQPSAAEDRLGGAFRLGEKVILRALGSEGVIRSLSESEAEVQIGALRIRAKLGEILRKQEAESAAQPVKAEGRKAKVEARQPASTPLETRQSPGLELDLRGQRAEDALLLLESYLDRAYLAGLPFVRIIHGKGTGKLRQEVRAALKGHPQVGAFEEGLPSEGGDGVTVAKMVKD
ncbi:MAG: endonuclease MutS2 [Anaerolineales bacterium]